MSILQTGRYLLRSLGSVHRQGDKQNIFLFATPRGGSTWVMEIIASQPGMKYYDEPLNIRRANVQKAGVFTRWEQLMPEGCDSQGVFDYFRALERNEYRYMSPPPLRKNHHFVTDRIVFKIHELDHMVNEIERELSGQIVYLLRHPIPNTISRKVYPRLEAYLESSYYRERFLDAAQHAEIKRLASKGSKLQQGMVSWCYENLVPLKHSDTANWLMITYEEILLNPLKSCRLMSERLELDDLDAMLKAVDEPSSNISMSDATTQDLMRIRNEEQRKLGLVRKWTSKVSDQEERQAFEVMKVFGLDTYSYGRLIANDRYLHFDDTAERVAEDDYREAMGA